MKQNKSRLLQRNIFQCGIYELSTLAFFIPQTTFYHFSRQVFPLKRFLYKEIHSQRHTHINNSNNYTTSYCVLLVKCADGRDKEKHTGKSKQASASSLSTTNRNTWWLCASRSLLYHPRQEIHFLLLKGTFTAAA